MILCNVYDIAGLFYDVRAFRTYRVYMLPMSGDECAANEEMTP
jgi:hypothetical protein